MNIDNKFKSNPYNEKNNLIFDSDINNIMLSLNIADFKINNIDNFQQAFIHKSYCMMNDYKDFINNNNSIDLFNKSYETLEFIGDSILGNIVSCYLFNRFCILHNKDEGFLTKLKIKLVCGEQLGFLSDKLNFNKYMIISKHIDDNCDGRNNKNILEDIFEAFIGALYIDNQSQELIHNFIIKTIEKYIDFTDLIIKDNNYKDQILKYFQHNYKVYPTYKSFKDDELNLFICKIFKNDELIETGKGNSKKKSEQNASKNALIKFHVLSE
jgi:ribonuclease III